MKEQFTVSMLLKDFIRRSLSLSLSLIRIIIYFFMTNITCKSHLFRYRDISYQPDQIVGDNQENVECILQKAGLTGYNISGNEQVSV